jgi:hypothetical protein
MDFYVFPARLFALSSPVMPWPSARESPYIFLDFIFETAVVFLEKRGYAPGVFHAKGPGRSGRKNATM